MRFVGASALKDLRRLARDPLGLALALATPLIITLLVSAVFAGDNPTPQGRLLVVDEDDTLVSSLLRGAFGQGPLGKMLVVEMVERADGEARIDRGDASALLHIPKGFEKAVLRNEPCELRLVTNPAQRILPGIVVESLSMMLDAEFYIQSLLPGQFRRFADGPPTEQDVAEASVAVRRLVQSLQRYLDPVLIKLETTALEEKKPVNIGALFLPGMLIFAVILVAQTLSADLWKEKAGGTLRRTLTTPSRLGAFLAGKLLAAGAVFGGVGLIGLACARWLVHLPLAAPLAVQLWVMATGVTVYLLLLLVNLYASGERGGSVLTSLVVFVCAMVGGSFFPFEMMPGWLAAAGRWTPNGWAVVQFKALAAGTAEPGALLAAAGGLAAVGAVAFVLVLRRLPRWALL